MSLSVLDFYKLLEKSYTKRTAINYLGVESADCCLFYPHLASNHTVAPDSLVRKQNLGNSVLYVYSNGCDKFEFEWAIVDISSKVANVSFSPTSYSTPESALDEAINALEGLASQKSIESLALIDIYGYLKSLPKIREIELNGSSWRAFLKHEIEELSGYTDDLSKFKKLHLTNFLNTFNDTFLGSKWESYIVYPIEVASKMHAEWVANS